MKREKKTNLEYLQGGQWIRVSCAHCAKEKLLKGEGPGGKRESVRLCKASNNKREQQLVRRQSATKTATGKTNTFARVSCVDQAKEDGDAQPRFFLLKIWKCFVRRTFFVYFCAYGKGSFLLL